MKKRTYQALLNVWYNSNIHIYIQKYTHCVIKAIRLNTYHSHHLQISKAYVWWAFTNGHMTVNTIFLHLAVNLKNDMISSFHRVVFCMKSETFSDFILLVTKTLNEMKGILNNCEVNVKKIIFVSNSVHPSLQNEVNLYASHLHIEYNKVG